MLIDMHTNNVLSPVLSSQYGNEHLILKKAHVSLDRLNAVIQFYMMAVHLTWAY